MQLTLKHPNRQDHNILVSALSDEWLDHMVIIPQLPYKLVGFKHPEAALDEEFVLHGTHSLLVSPGLRPTEGGMMATHQHPPVIIPLDLLFPVNMVVAPPAFAILLSMQDKEYREAIRSLMLQVVDPPRVSLASSMPSLHDK